MNIDALPPTPIEQPTGPTGPVDAVPRWQDVSATEKFQAATPEKKLVAFDRWQQAARPYVSTLPNYNPAAFEAGVQGRMAEYSKAAGGIDPTGARIKVASDAVDQAKALNTDPNVSPQENARAALRPLGSDVIHAYVNAHPLPPLPTNPATLPADDREQSISASPTILGEAAKGHLVTAATMAYHDVRDSLRPFLGVSEGQKVAESIPWGKNADGSTHFEYRPLGGGPDEQGLIPGLMKMAMVNPETLIRASGADADSILYYPHDANDSTAMSVAKGTFNAAQGLLQTFLSPAVLMGFGGASPTAQKWISAGFTADMGSKIIPSIQAANNAKDPQEFVQNLLEAATSIAFAGKAGEHALTPTPKVFGPKEIVDSVGSMSDNILKIAGSSPEFTEASPNVAAAVHAELEKRGLKPETPTQVIQSAEVTPQAQAADKATAVIDAGAAGADKLAETGSPEMAKVVAEQANADGTDVARTPEAEVTAPEGANTPEEVRKGLGELGKGVSASFFDSAFKALQEGKDKIAGIKDPILAKAKPFFDAGLIKTAEEFHSLYQDGTIEKGLLAEAAPAKPLHENVLSQGKIGETHKDLADAIIKNPDTPTDQLDAAIEAGTNDKLHGFVDSDGNVLDRKRAARVAMAAGQIKPEFFKFYKVGGEGNWSLDSRHLQESTSEGTKIEGPALLKIEPKVEYAPAPTYDQAQAKIDKLESELERKGIDPIKMINPASPGAKDLIANGGYKPQPSELIKAYADRDAAYAEESAGQHEKLQSDIEATGIDKSVAARIVRQLGFNKGPAQAYFDSQSANAIRSDAAGALTKIYSELIGTDGNDLSRGQFKFDLVNGKGKSDAAGNLALTFEPSFRSEGGRLDTDKAKAAVRALNAIRKLVDPSKPAIREDIFKGKEAATKTEPLPKPEVNTQLGVPEGVKPSAKPAPVPLNKLPTVNEGGVIKPAWTNDPTTIAHQIDAGAVDTSPGGKGNLLYIPEVVMEADPPVLDPRIQFATEKQPDGSYKDYVTGVDHEKYGLITDKGQYTERYEADKEVQARREAQTKGKEFQLTQERPDFDEKLNALPPHPEEGSKVAAFIKDKLDPYLKGRGKGEGALNTTLTDRIRDAAIKEATYRLRKDGEIKSPKSIIKSIESSLVGNIENKQSFDRMVEAGDPVARHLESSPYEQISDIHFGPSEEAHQEGAMAASGNGPVDEPAARKNLTEAQRLGLRSGGVGADGKFILTKLSESKNEGLRLIAKALLGGKVELSKLKFKLYNDPSDNTAASYVPNTSDITKGTIHLNLGIDQPVSVEASLLHEIGHHFTLTKLDPTYEHNPAEKEAYNGIAQAYDIVSRQVFEAENGRAPKDDAELAAFQKKNLDEGGLNYWIGSIHEFVQSALTEPRSQGIIASNPEIKGQPKVGKFAGLLANLKAWLNQIFVGKKITEGSLMDQAVNNILTLATETPLNHEFAAPVGEEALATKGTAEEPKEEPEPRTVGIAQRVHDAQGVPVEPGVGMTPKAAIARGHEQIAAGADPEARLTEVAKANYALNADDMSLFRAHYFDLRKAYFKAVDEGDPAKIKAAQDAAIDWAKRVKPAQTEWSKVGAAQQGETEIDTGSFHGLQYDFVARTGRDFTPKETETAKDIVATTQKADADIAEKTKAFSDAIEAEAAKIPSDEGKGAGEGADSGKGEPTTPRKPKGPVVPTDAEGLRKYFEDKFKDHTGTEAKFTQPEVAAVWKYTKENFIDGNHLIELGDLVQSISSELGIRPVWVRELLAANKTLRTFNAELYKAQNQRTAVLRAARTWLEDSKKDPLARKLETIWNFRRALSVLGHVNAPLTHAGSSLFVPNETMHMISSVRRGFKYFLDPVFHRAQMESLLQDKDYSEFAKAGLGIKPGLVEDVAEYQHIFGKFGVAGDRGMDILKTMRLERMKQRVAQLPPDLRADPEVINEMAQLVNVETGLVNKGILGEALGTKLARNTLFAARLEGSRWQNIFVNTARAGRIITKWNSATPAEQVFAKHVLRRNGTLAAVYLSALGANQAALSAAHSQDSVNFTDPTKSDWLAFKWNGHVVGAPSSFLSPLRFTLGLAMTPFIKGANNSSVFGKFGDYLGGKVNPTISDIAELMHGKQLFTSRPLPWMHPSKLRSAKPPLSYAEYALSKSPIPIAQVAQEVSNSFHDPSVPATAMKTLIDASLAGASSIFAIHTHPVHEEPKKAKKVLR